MSSRVFLITPTLCTAESDPPPSMWYLIVCDVLFLFQTSGQCKLIYRDRGGPERSARSHPNPEPSVLAPCTLLFILLLLCLHVPRACSQKKQAQSSQHMQTGCDCCDQADTSVELCVCQVFCHAPLHPETRCFCTWEQLDTTHAALW